MSAVAGEGATSLPAALSRGPVEVTGRGVDETLLDA